MNPIWRAYCSNGWVETTSQLNVVFLLAFSPASGLQHGKTLLQLTPVLFLHTTAPQRLGWVGPLHANWRGWNWCQWVVPSCVGSLRCFFFEKKNQLMVWVGGLGSTVWIPIGSPLWKGLLLRGIPRIPPKTTNYPPWNSPTVRPWKWWVSKAGISELPRGRAPIFRGELGLFQGGSLVVWDTPK